MSAACCPLPADVDVPDAPRVDVQLYNVHPRGTCVTAEVLADRLDAEARAHSTLTQSLVTSHLELARLRPVESAALQVLAVVDAPTTCEEQDAHLGRLNDALTELRAALAAEPPPGLVDLAEVHESSEPFLQIARDRLAWRSSEPVSHAACRRSLRAHGEQQGEEVGHG